MGSAFNQCTWETSSSDRKELRFSIGDNLRTHKCFKARWPLFGTSARFDLVSKLREQIFCGIIGLRRKMSVVHFVLQRDMLCTQCLQKVTWLDVDRDHFSLLSGFLCVPQADHGLIHILETRASQLNQSSFHALVATCFCRFRSL